jgi:hypothetical protein
MQSDVKAIGTASPASDGFRSVTTAIIIFLLCALPAIGYGLTQDLMAYENGQPYDAGSYMKMASDAAQHQVMSADKPFVYRIMLPYLVGRFFDGDLMHGFLVFNLIAGALIVLVLYPLLRMFTTNAIAIAVVLVTFVVNPNAPFRFSFFYPAFTDSPALLFILLILFIGIRFPTITVARTATLTILTGVGVLCREIVLLAPLAMLLAGVYRWLVDRKAFPLRLMLAHAGVPVVIGLGTIYITHLLVEPVGDYTFLGHATGVLLRNVTSPSIYVLSVFTAYGPLILVLAIEWRAVVETIKARPELAAFALLLAPIAAIGGYHTDRFLYWAFPAVLPLQVVTVDRLMKSAGGVYRTVLIASIVVSQVLAFRVFGSIPNAGFDALGYPGRAQYILFAPYGNEANFAQTFASFMGLRSRAILSAEYCVLIGWVFLLTWRWRGRVFKGEA